MANIKARVGSQNVVKVLSNSPAGVQRLVNLKDVDENTLLDGALLVWNTSSSNFIMTNVVDTTLTIAGSVDAFGAVTNTESTSFNNGALVVQGGVGISGNLNVAGIATFGTGTIVVDGDNDLVTVGTGVTISSSEGIDTPSLRIAGPLSAEQLNISGISTLARLGGITTTGGDLFVGQNLHVAGISTFIGNATFRGGTIGIGDSSSDDINVQGEFVSNLIPNTTDTYDIGSLSQKWRNAYFAGTGEFNDLLTVGSLESSGISTAETFSGFTNLQAINSGVTKTFKVTVAAKTVNHKYYNTGSSQAYLIDNVESPTLTLVPGTTYRFDQSDNTNNGHPLLFYLTGAKDHQYSTNVIQNGSPGNAGAYTEITIEDDTPTVLHYQCASHSYMGSAIITDANKVETPYSAIFHGNIDVDGNSELDDVNVSGSSTIAGTLDVNGGLQADTAIIEDLTDNRVVIVGNGGELEDDSNFTFDGSVLSVGVNLDVDGLSELDELNVSGIATFASDLDINSSVNISNNLEVVGITTIGSLLDLNGGLQVDTVTVEDLTNDRVVIVGAGGELEDDANFTFNGSELTVGTATTGVVARTDGTLNVSGVTTFQSSVNLGDNDRLNFYTTNTTIYGSAFGLNVEASGNNDILIKSNSSGGNSGDIKLRTVEGGRIDLTGTGGVGIYHTDTAKKLETTGIGVSILGVGNTATITGPENLVIDPAGVGDNTGVVRIKGDLFVDGTQTQINSTTIELADFVVGIATTATSDLLADGAGLEIGPNDNTFKYYYNSGNNSSLKSSENLNVAVGKHYQIDQVEVLNATTLGAGVTDSSLTNVGTLIDLNVSGLTDLDGGLDVLGHSELDNLNVSGLSTYVGIATYQSDVFVDGTLTAGVIDGGTY